MNRFRRIAAAAALLTLLTAATATPAAAAPWRTGFEDVGMRVQWRMVSWVLKHVGTHTGLTNTRASESSKVVP